MWPDLEHIFCARRCYQFFQIGGSPRRLRTEHCDVLLAGYLDHLFDLVLPICKIGGFSAWLFAKSCIQGHILLQYRRDESDIFLTGIRVP
ncbi:hypothetical protein KBC03_05805 [Patescibacteria group bacterium]|nr:hypothetical protein [Patescibacteria group bacterium]